MHSGPPDLVDLVNDIERRLIGSAPGPGLPQNHADLVPERGTYVVVVFDGLGSHQLDHESAGDLRRCHVADLSAPFPTTTTVAMATIATGLPPRTHGTIGHLMWLPDLGEVVNTLKWVTPTGTRLDIDTERFLPAPNLWERLSAEGVEPITVQPLAFEETPLSRALYRGCRFEGVSSESELIEATTTLARSPNRLILAYVPHVDVAAHVAGRRSSDYARALRIADDIWSGIRHRAPSDVAVVGTADHGHLDYASGDKYLIRDPAYADLTFYGDPRSLMVRGELELIERLAQESGGTAIPREELRAMLGPSTAPDHPELDARLPDALVLAPEGRLLLPRGFDKRLIGYHGGNDPREVTIPLLVA